MFSFKSSSPPPVSGGKHAVPDGLRVYAVGDIHGRADLLIQMGDLVWADMVQRPIDDCLTVFLGDYIDRGPDSAGVLHRLARGLFPTPIITLAGNHDDVFKKFLTGAIGLEGFLSVGGDATLRSYGLDPEDLLSMPPDELVYWLGRSVPDEHWGFVHSLPFSHVVGDYFFCHAGARPGVPLDRQSQEDLIWIRQDFLRSTYDFGKMIVHGHTPVKAPEIRVNGIDVDTKAFASGILTAVVLQGTERRFLQTAG